MGHVNVLPIAIVTTDSNGNVTSITDARWMLYSLETGGLNPNPNYTYPWTEGQVQPPVTTTSNSVNPFVGGDKQLSDLKDWMNAVMSQIQGIQGTPSWFSPLGPTTSILSLLQDLGNTVITGSGEISHGILPNADAILVTSGSITAGSNQLTVSSVAGLSVGDFIFGTGIPEGTTILAPSTVSSPITMSKPATLNGSSIGITFYSPSVITQPGQINWDQPISIRVIGTSLMYTLAANPSSTDITLADDEVAYITLVNNQPITPNLIFVGGSPTIDSVGAVSWTSGLLPGDYIKVASDTVSGYYQILTIDNPSQVTLTTNVLAGDNSGLSGVKAQYAFGSYSAASSPSTNRNIFIAPRADVPAGAFWLFLREDNGGTPRVYIRFLAQELDNGESVEVSGTTSLELLQYIGSSSASDSSPQYVSALNPGSVPQITNLFLGAGSTITGGQYFLINSSGNAREYVAWFKVSGVGTAPVVANTNGLIEIDILSTDTAAQVAAKVQIALDSTPLGDFSALVGSEYAFTTSPASATAGATYTNNGQTFTVVATISGGTTLITTGTGAPTASGTLTLVSGSGDATITFSAFTASSAVIVTNTSAGISNDASNIDVGAPFAVAIIQEGTGTGNFFIHDADNLTLAVKELDLALGNFETSLNAPTYDETVEIVASGATPPTSLNGPVANSTVITLPLNSREGNTLAQYTVGKGVLEVFLNGQFLDVESGAYAEVGTAGTPSNQIEILTLPGGGLVVGDELEFRFSGGGGGSGGGPGPAGPAGPTGPAGLNGSMTPVSFSTKVSDYTYLTGDCFLMADCTSGPITFTLPVASTVPGRFFYATKIDASANTLTVVGNGSDLINEASTLVFVAQDQEAGFFSVSSGWRVV